MEVSSKLKIAITGTSSGIGRATVNLLSQHNFTQFNRPQYNLLNDDVLDSIDLSDYDVLINNAGADYARQPFDEHDYQDWKNTVKINLVVPMYLTQKFIQQNSKGIVVNVTSIANHKLPTTNSTVFYRSSKVALKHFTKEINETHTNFRIINIEPGKTDTCFTYNAGSGIDYSKHSMCPEDVAHAIKLSIENPNVSSVTLQK